MKNIKIYSSILAIFLLLSGCVATTPGIPPQSLSKQPPSSMAPKNKISEIRRITVLLPLTGPSASAGEAIRNGFLAAYNYSNANNPNFIQIQIFDTNKKSIKNLYTEAITTGANFIVGPLTKSEVTEISNTSLLAIPTLALNTLPNSKNAPPENFYQFGLSTQDEAIQAAHKIRQDGYKKVLTIAPANSWSKNIIDPFKNNLEKVNGKVLDSLYYTKTEDLSLQIARLLNVDPENLKKNEDGSSKKLDPLTYRRQDFDAIFLATNPEDARQIKPLLTFHYAGTIPVYATSTVYSENSNPQMDFDLDGIIFCDAPWVLNKHGNKLYALGIDAYYLINFLSTKNAFPIQGLSGTTGVLFLDKHNHIYRRLTWAKFQNGVPKTLAPY